MGQAGAVVDPPDDEVAHLLGVGPERFVASRTDRVRALRADGRRQEAAALAKVRKPRRLTWVLVDLARAEPSLVAAAVDAGAALEVAQSGGGGRVRPLLGAMRDAVEAVTAAAVHDSSQTDRAEVGLAVRQVLAEEDARRAWVSGLLLAVPEPDTEGGLAPSRTTRPTSDAGGAAPARDAEVARRVEDERRAERQREAEAQRRVVAAEADRAAAVTRVEAAEEAASDLEVELQGLRARRDAAREALFVARRELAASDASLAAAREAAGG